MKGAFRAPENSRFESDDRETMAVLRLGLGLSSLALPNAGPLGHDRRDLDIAVALRLRG